MMRNVLMALMILAAAPATAAELWLDAALGRNTLNLAEVTDGPVTYRGYDLRDGSLDSGTSLCGTLAIVVHRDWSLGVAYDRLMTETSGLSGAATLDASLPTHLLRAVARWSLLHCGSAEWCVTGGLGMVDVSGTASTSGDPTFALQGEVEGTGLAAELGLSLRLLLRPTMGLSVDTGVRRARIGSVMVGGGALQRDDDGETVPFDFGGAYLKAGLTVLLPSSVGNPD